MWLVASAHVFSKYFLRRIPVFSMQLSMILTLVSRAMSIHVGVAHHEDMLRRARDKRLKIHDRAAAGRDPIARQTKKTRYLTTPEMQQGFRRGGLIWFFRKQRADGPR